MYLCGPHITTLQATHLVSLLGHWRELCDVLHCIHLRQHTLDMHIVRRICYTIPVQHLCGSWNEELTQRNLISTWEREREKLTDDNVTHYHHSLSSLFPSNFPATVLYPEEKYTFFSCDSVTHKHTVTHTTLPNFLQFTTKMHPQCKQRGTVVVS